MTSHLSCDLGLMTKLASSKTGHLEPAISSAFVLQRGDRADIVPGGWVSVQGSKKEKAKRWGMLLTLYS